MEREDAITGRLRDATKVRLYRAGWRTDRDVWGGVKLPSSPDVFPEARRIISSFGGLRFRTRAEDVLLEPATIRDEPELLTKSERAVGLRLYPLGYQVHQDREYLFVDERGLVYKQIAEFLYLFAPNFEIALEWLADPDRPWDADAALRRHGLTERDWALEENSQTGAS